MLFEFDTYYIDSVHEKYAWRICDFCTINAERLQRFFPNTLEQNRTPDLSRYFVERKLKAFSNKEEYLFVLKEKKDHTLIGLLYVKEVDWIKKQSELAYCIGYQYEGNGYMTESVSMVSDWALKELQLQHLQIIVHRSNIGSVRVAEKCGYIWTRTLEKKFAPPRESLLDMELYERHA